MRGGSCNIASNLLLLCLVDVLTLLLAGDRVCREYEEAIHEAGGIDLQLLGMGRLGHIGFNERG
jgi:6-phosphogluconolactonase/glucosamine-6-phosphate isomerase/deaminase